MRRNSATLSVTKTAPIVMAWSAKRASQGARPDVGVRRQSITWCDRGSRAGAAQFAQGFEAAGFYGGVDEVAAAGDADGFGIAGLEDFGDERAGGALTGRETRDAGGR